MKPHRVSRDSDATNGRAQSMQLRRRDVTASATQYEDFHRRVYSAVGSENAEWEAERIKEWPTGHRLLFFHKLRNDHEVVLPDRLTKALNNDAESEKLEELQLFLDTEAERGWPGVHQTLYLYRNGMVYEAEVAAVVHPSNRCNFGYVILDGFRVYYECVEG
jgi:hypothetical protein